MTAPRALTDPISPWAEANGGAVGAILIAPDGRFLMQHRDERPGVWFGGFWGMFGGAVDPGEAPEAALRRELREELETVPAELVYFSQVAFDLRRWGRGIRLRRVFVGHLTAEDLAAAVLHEGQAMRLFSEDELLREPRLTPYDSHILRLYIHSAAVDAAPLTT
jgi:8-oxo-dGTP pyrophosphatase MutT (NUDIX family)